MNNVPFLHVNIVAICCYLIMLAAFIAAEKTNENKTFTIVLLTFILWTGGSVLMRLQMYPGVDFWFYVSLLALFTIPLMMYFFTCSFANERGYFLKIIWTVGTVILLAVTVTGYFVQPPAIVIRGTSETIFVYETSWRIAIPCTFIVMEIISMLGVVYRLIRTQGIRTPGLLHIIWGLIIIAVGNMVQPIPGNVFPTDTLAGIIFAVLTMYALYKKRVFKLKLLVSPNVLLLLSMVIGFITAASFLNSIEGILTSVFHLGSDDSRLFVTLIFTIIIAVIYALLRKLIFAIFSKDEKQSEMVKNFSNEVTQSLKTAEVIEKLTGVICEEVDVEKIFIFLKEEDRFVPRYVSNPLSFEKVSFSKESSCIKYLENTERYFLINEFKTSSYYRSMWESEKIILSTLHIQFVIALKSNEEIIGLILLPGKDKNHPYSNNEIEFIVTVSAIASIAVKNAMPKSGMIRASLILLFSPISNQKA